MAGASIKILEEEEMLEKELYTKETTWGTHWVSKGLGKHTGKFIAQSRGAGGAEGYFQVKDTLEEAKAVVDRETTPIIDDEPPIKF